MPETQDILGLGFNVAEVERQKSLIVGYFKEILTGAEQFNNLKISFANLSGGIADFTRANNQLATSSDNVAKAQARVDIAIKNYDDTLKKANATTKETNAANQQVVQAQKQLAEAIKTTNIEEREALKTDKLREDQARRTAAAIKQKVDANVEIPFTSNLKSDGSIIEPTQGATSGTAVSEVERAQVEGILTAKEYAEAQKGVSSSFVQSQANAAKYAVTQKEIDLALAQDKLTAQKRTAELKNQVREETAIKGSIEQRRAALIRLNAVYDNLSPQERNSAAGQRLQKITKGVTDQLKELEAASGRAQRNVGNYPTNSFNGLKAQLKDVTDQYNSLTKAEQKSAQGKELKGKMDEITKSVKDFGNSSTVSFKSAYSGIRLLANILPGLGISGIFLLAGQAIAATVDYIKELGGRVVDFAERMKALSQVNLKAIESFGEQRSHIEGLTAVIKDGNISLEDKSRALKDLIALDPKYLHGLTMANITTDEGKKILGDYVSLLQRKAELEAAQAVSGDASKEVYKLEVIKDLLRKRLVATKTNYDDLTEEELKYVDKVKTSTGRINFTASLLNLEIPKSDIQEMLVGVDKELLKAGKKVTASMDVFKTKFKAVGDKDVQLGIVESLKKQISDIEKAIEFEPIKAKIPELVATRKKLQEELDKLLDTKKGKETSKNIATIADAVSELRKELAAIQGKVDLGELAPSQADLDRVKAYQKAFEDIFKRGGKTTTPIVQQLSLELDPIETRVLEAQIKDFAQKVRSDAKVEVPLEVDTARLDLIIKNTSDAVQKIVDSNDNLYAKDLENLNKRLIAKEITQEDYNKAIEQLQKDHVRTEISNSIELNQALIDNLKARGFDVTKFEEKLNEQKQKLYELDAKAAIDADNKKKKSAEDLSKAKNFLQEKEIQLGKELANLGSTLVEASIENQKNKLQELEDLQQKNYENQVQRINSSTLTDAQKADQLTVLEKQRQAQKDKNEREQRDLDIKKAKFERLVAVANIVAATATAEVQALTYLSNPFTAPLYPAIAATIAAIGATQIAALLATPIPKYATGTTDHPGGWAEVGEGQYKELVEMPGGHSFIADRAMVMDLPQHTKVTPITNDDINKMLYKGMMAQTAANIQAKPDKSERILLDIHRELKKNNGKKLQFNAHIKYDTTWDSYKKKYYS
jgi:hypothetical protein